MLLKSGARLGPHEIVAPLGAGGMREVYEARDTRLDRTLATRLSLARAKRSPFDKAVLRAHPSTSSG